MFDLSEIDGISIHTPHAGSDSIVEALTDPDIVFQSTLPMRGATQTIPHGIPR